MRDRFFRFQVVSAKLLFGSLLVLVVGLWAWNLIWSWGRFSSPSVALRTPICLLRTCAGETGLAFLVAESGVNRGFELSFGGTHFLGTNRLDLSLKLLGFEFAFLATPVDERCYVVPPHVAVVLPYWLLFILSFVGYLLVSNMLGRIVARLHASNRAKIVMVAVLLLALVLNLLPSDGKSGRSSDRDSVLARLTLIFLPEMFPNVHLGYGFPLEHYECVFVGGQWVTNHLGAPLGWKPARAMENLVIALLAAGAVGLVVERFRGRREPSASTTESARKEDVHIKSGPAY